LSRKRVANEVITASNNAEPVLKENRKYLIIPEQGQIFAFDTATGKKLGSALEPETLIRQLNERLKTPAFIRKGLPKRIPTQIHSQEFPAKY
jgi:hypothetical protein